MEMICCKPKYIEMIYCKPKCMRNECMGMIYSKPKYLGNECMRMIRSEPKCFVEVCFKTVYFENEYSEYPFWVPLKPILDLCGIEMQTSLNELPPN
jgi:hypothetical protein